MPAPRRGRTGASRARARAARKPARRWLQRVTETSDALDLEPGVFTSVDPAAVARSLRRSAEASRWRKAVLEAAKDELRALYDRPRRSGERRCSA